MRRGVVAGGALLTSVRGLWFVRGRGRSGPGAAEAPVIPQYVSGIGFLLYTLARRSEFRGLGRHLHIRAACLREVASYSFLTCIQQSVMNLGILMVQGLVNSFGPTIMAAFAAAVKIDSFAYLPVQDFGNAFSTFIAQNYGAKQSGRIRAGLKGAVAASMGFGVVLSALVWVFAAPLMGLFVEAGGGGGLPGGGPRLPLAGALHCGRGVPVCPHRPYRALGKPGMSVVLTVISLGTRVALAYLLSATPLGVTGIWWSVPIGWALADAAGLGYYLARRKKLLAWEN